MPQQLSLAIELRCKRGEGVPRICVVRGGGGPPNPNAIPRREERHGRHRRRARSSHVELIVATRREFSAKTARALFSCEISDLVKICGPACLTRLIESRTLRGAGVWSDARSSIVAAAKSQSFPGSRAQPRQQRTQTLFGKVCAAGLETRREANRRTRVQERGSQRLSQLGHLVKGHAHLRLCRSGCNVGLGDLLAVRAQHKGVFPPYLSLLVLVGHLQRVRVSKLH